MQANRILLQRKYSRIIEMFARSANIPLEQALDFFLSFGIVSGDE